MLGVYLSEYIICAELLSQFGTLTDWSSIKLTRAFKIFGGSGGNIGRHGLKTCTDLIRLWLLKILNMGILIRTHYCSIELPSDKTKVSTGAWVLLEPVAQLRGVLGAIAAPLQKKLPFLDEYKDKVILFVCIILNFALLQDNVTMCPFC